MYLISVHNGIECKLCRRRWVSRWHKTVTVLEHFISRYIPEMPEFYIVQPAPSTSSAKIERNDRRVFINRGTMEKMGLFQGSVVLIQRHDPNRWTPATAPVLPEDGEDD